MDTKNQAEQSITSVAAHEQISTNYKITVDGINYTLKLNQVLQDVTSI